MGMSLIFGLACGVFFGCFAGRCIKVGKYTKAALWFTGGGTSGAGLDWAGKQATAASMDLLVVFGSYAFAAVVSAVFFMRITSRADVMSQEELSKRKPLHRAVVIYRLYENKSWSEIGRLLGLDTDEVKKIYKEALRGDPESMG